MGFSRQEYWSGFCFPSPGDLPGLGIKPMYPAMAGGFFAPEPPGKLNNLVSWYKYINIYIFAFVYLRRKWNHRGNTDLDVQIVVFIFSLMYPLIFTAKGMLSMQVAEGSVCLLLEPKPLPPQGWRHRGHSRTTPPWSLRGHPLWCPQWGPSPWLFRQSWVGLPVSKWGPPLGDRPFPWTGHAWRVWHHHHWDNLPPGVGEAGSKRDLWGAGRPCPQPRDPRRGSSLSSLPSSRRISRLHRDTRGHCGH